MSSFISKIRHAQDNIFKGIVALMFIAAIVYIFPREGKFKYEFEKGKPWLHENLIAPFDFAINKSEVELEEERNEIIKNFRPYFKSNEKIEEYQLIKFTNSFNKIWKKHVDNERYDRFNHALYNEVLSSSNSSILKNQYLELGTKIIHEIYAAGIIKIDEVIEGKASDFEIVVINENNIAEDRDLRHFYSIKQAYEFIDEKMKQNPGMISSFLIPQLQDVLKQNIEYDYNTSEKILSSNLDNISLTRGVVQKNEKVIDNGNVVTEALFNKLNSFKSEYEKFVGGSTDYYAILTGQCILISLLIGVLIAFLALFRKEVIQENDKFVFILLLIGLMVYMTSLAGAFDEIKVYALPLCILPIIARSFFDVRTATFTHIITTILIGFIVPNSFEFVFVQTLTGIIAIFALTGLERRSQLVATTFFIFLSYSVAYLGFSLIHEGTFEDINFMNFTWFGASALLTLLSYPIMYVFEKTFSFVSDVTLIELSNTNNPLLRELAETVPGTFQHSIQVANLAESAVQVVGGNPLLIRTGALYHDIGKMKNPAFFIENQGGSNPHDELNYKDSARIIIEHVIHGIELAKKHGLPEQIIDFIRTHHGTSSTRYFLKMHQMDHPDQEIDEKVFRYGGPTPFSKETAILMMADAVEAATRSLKEHSHDIISNMVNGLIDDQAADNQFINADITYKDIREIKEIFTKKLMNIYHVRIEYPT